MNNLNKQKNNHFEKQKNEKNISAYLVGIGLLVLALGVLIFYFMGSVDSVAGSSHKWIILSVFILILLLGILFVYLAYTGKIKKQDPDYRAFFIMGITWIPVGIVINNYGISAMGLIFMITGLVNKDKWKKQKWSELSDEKKRLKLLIILFLGASMLLGLIMYLIFNNK
ncbi:hypothetical protein A2331_00405 [Candidatus Falkowbacteria bacterium RIFOXYB2_FULL_34_18]|uniref:Uncharacterized protein n=1 Tax=Candidatus Falkowbacteria bacterium RIFOXYD2_FULL_34_120 TaxID=1798007 RepID=A0A1F5TNX7_9BACT|nr:MAG: hypothetical protein A2331_00405 [Candidatus Falkowbacteria bacterium RIFOXYB2_FULL_34_18]OGF28510.1 MAG: hypothetical protein A2500_06630 [Candidatus Falkowbacteria bacterium RIFOXYC12_FULL_34_55]OGF38153.1 MAG: hypothetical protein A2466_00165 [Candidatus Falkowbacteria bacterium RIFOXYC2_FULL_34_220]OGF38528.1 MAG: hypothetical protein A2515_05065 [Candidatus Falkowbacteria bacterium RIFOXYD12_FULL_34_57]OGF40221.1 MAG: hypothetical protein A2531_04690 [Candidatus Falkowbacteria bact